MFRNLMVINAGLVVFIAFAAHRIRTDWVAFNEAHQASQVQAEAETLTGVSTPTAVSPIAPADWTAVPGRNPFTFDRNDQPIVIAAQSSAETVVGPKPVLFGTISLGKELMAMLGPGQGGNRGFKPMKTGEVLDGWQILEIHDKSVVIQARDRKETVLMNDPSAQVPREYTRTVAATAAPAASVSSAGASQSPQPSSPGPGSISSSPDVQRPIPLDANGQPRKGRWLKTPFGDVFVEERP